MTVIKEIILGVIGISGGLVVAGGVFAFITMLQVIPRLSARTGTANKIMLYESSVILGGVLANIIWVFEWKIPLGVIGLFAFGFFSGVFVGCLAVALAEVLDVIPVFSRRIGLKYGVPVIVLFMALGKACGAFYQLVMCQ